MTMNCVDIINYLESEASETYRANIIKMGIPEAYSIGVSTAALRKFAKQLDKSDELAFELWDTNYHEARLLAVFLFHPKTISCSSIDKLMSEVISWDLCDHLCKSLIIKRNDYGDFIDTWISSSHVYKKRAAFTLMASAAIHDKNISRDTIDTYLNLIYEHSDCEHEHIKKAVSWALRELGKVDFESNEKALLSAYDLMNSENKTQIWIAKDVIKELEHVVKADGRKRLISANTKMGRQPASRQ